MKIEEIIQEIREGKRAIENDNSKALKKAVKIVWPDDNAIPECNYRFYFEDVELLECWVGDDDWNKNFIKATYFMKLWHEQKSDQEFRLDQLIHEIISKGKELGLKILVQIE